MDKFIAHKFFSLLLSLIFGLILALSFAPFNFWPAAIIAIALWFALTERASSPKQAFILSYVFALAGYGFGLCHWIFLSVYNFSFSSIAASGVTLFSWLLLSLISALTILVYKYLALKTNPPLILRIFLFCAVIVLIEWCRTFSLLSFPISLGYPHINSFLNGWIPILGAFGVSFIGIFSGASLYTIIQHKSLRITLISINLILWLGGYSLNKVEWVHPIKPITISLIQANIGIDIKWNSRYRAPILQRYLDMTKAVQDSDMIIWSETALPVTYNQANQLLSELQLFVDQNDTVFFTGLVSETTNKQGDKLYYNSLLALTPHNNDTYLYHKNKLLPFGEYTPFEDYLIPLKKALNIPMSSFKPGRANQKIFKGNGIHAAPYICYEDMYPDYVRSQAVDANLLLAITDDSWFGNSFGPYQHLKISQMRAAELGRYLARSTNTGISALINHKGQIIQHSENLFTQETVTGDVMLMQGKTPYAVYGSWPTIILSLWLIMIAFFYMIYQKYLSRKK